MDTRVYFNHKKIGYLLAFILLLCGCSRDKVSDSRELYYPELAYPDQYDALIITDRSTDLKGGFSLGLHSKYMFCSFQGNYLSEYKNERLDKVVDYVFSKSSKKKGLFGPYLSDMGISGEVRLYADVALFGKPSGENLIEYFIVNQIDRYNQLICSYPELEPIEIAVEGMPLVSFLQSGTALFIYSTFSETRFDFINRPFDEPEEYELTLEIPTSRDTDWTKFHWSIIESGFVSTPQERVLKGSVQIKR